MKKLLLISLCLPFIGFGQQTYVPDDNFEQALINLGYDTFLDDHVATASIDTVTNLNVDYLNISDLTGIEDFISLENLRCKGNNLTNLNVSNNLYLLDLNCDNNYLTNLDLSSNTFLLDLDCDDNQIIFLDVSNNQALISLDCKRNMLTTINISSNIVLEKIDIKGNQINSLDLTNNINLYAIECDNNNLNFLDVKNGNNQLITTFTTFGNMNLYCINVDDSIYSASNWINIDSQHYFSSNCIGAYGCTDPLACNYDSTATINDSSCIYTVIWQQAFSICSGDSVAVGTNIYNTTGTYTDTLNASNGCDSILYTNVNIAPPIVFQQAFSICNGDSVAVGTNIYNTTGTYTDTLNASNGCDSILYTNVNIAPPIVFQQAFTICNGDSVVVGNNIYNTTGIYTDTLNASNGCDSVVYTNLTVEQNSSSYDTLSVGASIVWNGMLLNLSGDYSVTLINSVGCDSIVNLNLTVTTTSVQEFNNNKNLIKINNMLGQETPYRKNTPLIYIYDDGTVEKKIAID